MQAKAAVASLDRAQRVRDEVQREFHRERAKEHLRRALTTLDSVNALG
jgi:hypothetical protein